MELDKADELVNAAYHRVRNLDRFSRSAPIGKAELAIIVLQALGELSALADWTLGPDITDSIVERLGDNEREKFEKFPRPKGSFGLGLRMSLGGYFVLRYDLARQTDFTRIKPGWEREFYVGFDY